jgi:hypothetical protein
MENKEANHRQKGSGYLILNNGVRDRVAWEIDIRHDGFGGGCIRGDETLLKAAANDGAAKLLLAPDLTAAIAIDKYDHGQASFTILLTSTVSTVFRAQTILGSSPIQDGKQFSIRLLAPDGGEILLILPTTVVRDYLPVLQKMVPPESPKTSKPCFFRVPRSWRTSVTASHPFVCLHIDEEPPIALACPHALQLAAELIKCIKEIEDRSITTH